MELDGDKDRAITVSKGIDYFDELFKPEPGKKPKRFLDGDKWRRVSCYRVEADCICAVKENNDA